MPTLYDECCSEAHSHPLEGKEDTMRDDKEENHFVKITPLCVCVCVCVCVCTLDLVCVVASVWSHNLVN